jgi:ubiquinone/menaquinone biosynthesis C-methylase UbiE
MSASERTTDTTLSPAPIMEMASAFMQSRALLTACELDLFTVLGEHERSSGEASGLLHTDERATDRLMDALCAFGLLAKSGGRFRNTPLSARFLVRGAPESLGGLMHWVHLWESWGTLTAAVRKGGSVSTRPVGEHGEAWRTAFIAAMHGRARQHAPGVVASLDLEGVSRVLDVGGGSGAYAMEFVRARPGASAVIFDLPEVLPLTASYLKEAGLSARVALAAGDYDRDPLGDGFDLVFLSAILHSNSPEGNRELIRKAAAALTPSGQLVVQEFIVDEDRTGPPFAALFALNMLVGTAAGDTYTEAEVRRWMEEAGVSGLTRQDTPFGTTLIVGRKR